MTQEEENKLFEKTCIPFSSGTAYLMWEDSNCGNCVRSYVGDRSNMGSEETREMISRKLYCKLEYFLELGACISDVPYKICEEIGIESEQQGTKDLYVILKSRCNRFSDNENDRTPPEGIDPIPPNQLFLPLGLFEEELNEVRLNP